MVRLSLLLPVAAGDAGLGPGADDGAGDIPAAPVAPAAGPSLFCEAASEAFLAFANHDMPFAALSESLCAPDRIPTAA